ncbi:12816_t:CDS:2, partial [Gigaspora rosea]
VGNGTNSVDNKISLPEFMKLPSQNLNSLIDAIFPNISTIGIFLFSQENNDTTTTNIVYPEALIPNT